MLFEAGHFPFLDVLTSVEQSDHFKLRRRWSGKGSKRVIFIQSSESRAWPFLKFATFPVKRNIQLQLTVKTRRLPTRLYPAGLVGRYVPSWEECTQKGWQEHQLLPSDRCIPSASWMFVYSTRQLVATVGCSRENGAAKERKEGTAVRKPMAARLSTLGEERDEVPEIVPDGALASGKGHGEEEPGCRWRTRER